MIENIENYVFFHDESIVSNRRLSRTKYVHFVDNGDVHHFIIFPDSDFHQDATNEYCFKLGIKVKFIVGAGHIMCYEEVEEPDEIFVYGKSIGYNISTHEDDNELLIHWYKNISGLNKCL